MDIGKTTKYLLEEAIKVAMRDLISGRLIAVLSTRLAFLIHPVAAFVTSVLMGKIISPILDSIHESITREIFEAEAKKRGYKLIKAETDAEVTDAFGDI